MVASRLLGYRWNSKIEIDTQVRILYSWRQLLIVYPSTSVRTPQLELSHVQSQFQRLKSVETFSMLTGTSSSTVYCFLP